MTMKSAKIWCLVFIIFTTTPFVSFIIMKPILSHIDYGKRNAAYTYIYQGKYYDTAANSEDEKAPFPYISLENYSSFPSEFEKYFSDRLPYKKILVRFNSSVHYYLFKQSISKKVLIGEDDWLFLTSSVNYTYSNSPVLEDDLEKIACNLQNIKNMLAEKNINFVLLIAPNKETIYPEFLPDYIDISINPTQTDCVIDYIRKNTDISVVYPKRDLLDAKLKYPDLLLYHKLDTHWNNAGAYIACQSLLSNLGKSMPEISSMELQKISFSGSDLTNIIGMPIKSGTIDYIITSDTDVNTVLDEWDYNNSFKYHNDSKTGTIMVFRDSFSTALAQYLSTEYGTSIYPNINTDINQVDEYNPDIVVFEFVERQLFNLTSYTLN